MSASAGAFGATSRDALTPTPEQLFDALFCEGEVAEVWFDPTSLAAYIGAPVAAIQDALTRLLLDGRITATFDPDGSCYARVIEPSPAARP
jgi:hypothetical protein